METKHPDIETRRRQIQYRQANETANTDIEMQTDTIRLGNGDGQHLYRDAGR